MINNFGEQKDNKLPNFAKGNKKSNFSISKNGLFFPNLLNIDPKRIINTNNESEDILGFTESELNSLSYEEAIKYSKRTFCQYYFSMLKLNHSILFSFYRIKDYNSRIIKILLFFFFFASDLTVNALFFTEETMHQIYEDKGSFNFFYQIPQILYSSILSYLIGSIIKYLSTSEDDIFEIKEEKRNNTKDLGEKAKKLFKKLKIKLIFFFIISFIILVMFWYYITCFCGIYKNTQVHLIKDSLMSLLMSFIYPFCSLFFITILRILALEAPKKDKKYLYNFSQFIENFL